jgi:hypothetical protein
MSAYTSALAFSGLFLLSEVAVDCSLVALPKILEALLLGILFLNIVNLLFVYLVGIIRPAAEDFTHNFVFNWILLDVLDDLLVEVFSADEVMDMSSAMLMAAVFHHFCGLSIDFDDWSGWRQFQGFFLPPVVLFDLFLFDAISSLSASRFYCL